MLSGELQGWDLGWRVVVGGWGLSLQVACRQQQLAIKPPTLDADDNPTRVLRMLRMSPLSAPHRPHRLRGRLYVSR